MTSITEGPVFGWVGGLVGVHDGPGAIIEDSSTDVSVYGAEATSVGGLDDVDNFEGWDFSDVWSIAPAPDGEERPILQWQNDD